MKAILLAERALIAHLELTTLRGRYEMPASWLDESSITNHGDLVSRHKWFVRLFSGLTIAALSYVAADAQDRSPSAGFQRLRAEAASYIPLTYAETPTEENVDHEAGHDQLSEHADEHHGGSHQHDRSGHADGHGRGGHQAGGHGGHDLEIPPMIGSFSRGPGNNNVMFPVDRLIVVPQILALPALGAGAAPVTFTGPGPVDIFRPSTVTTVGGLQKLFRQHLLLPPQTVVGAVADSATFTTTPSLDQINASFAATLQPYDVVEVVAPPGTYNTAVDLAFLAANTISGQTVFDPTTSGVIRSGGTESVAPFNQSLAAGDTLDAFYAFDYVVNVPIPSPSADGLLGRSTVGANSSPVPTDRLYFDYSLVKNGVPYNRSENFDRFTIGIEKVFGEGDFSLEVRLPFVASMDHQLILENGQGASQTETGNALVILKHELGSNEHMLISGGLGLSVPTGSDVDVDSAAGKPLIRLVNESVHMKPFLAMAFVPDDRFFMSSFLEYDLPAGRNEAQVNLDGMGLQPVGRFRDASHILWDISAGYWSEAAEDSVVRRWAPVVEFHFDKGFSDGSQVRGNSFRLFDISQDRSGANLLAGVTLDLNEGKYFSFGYGTGVGGDGSSSDGEFRATLNWPFDFK
jgi:hypothetical protein